MRSRALAIVFASIAIASTAFADDGPSNEELAEASALYTKGEELHAQGKHLEAARTLARADEIVPDAAALEAALVAVLETDAAVLGMNLASRTSREPFRTRHIELADRARAKFGSAVGRIVVHCDGCHVRIDGEVAKRGIATWVTAGSHRVDLSGDDGIEQREVDVAAEALVTITPRLAPPPPDPVPPPPEEPIAIDTGLSPIWFWIGAGATGVAGIATIASAVDVENKHASFEEMPTEELSSAGEQAEIRTNALLGVTIGVAAVTGLLAAFTDWSADDPDSAWTVTPQGQVRVSF